MPSGNTALSPHSATQNPRRKMCAENARIRAMITSTST